MYVHYYKVVCIRRNINIIVLYCIVSYGIVSYRIVLYHVVSCRVVSCRVVSCRVVSCRVVSCRVVSCRVVSCRVVSCRVVSYRIVLHCIALYCIAIYILTFLQLYVGRVKDERFPINEALMHCVILFNISKVKLKVVRAHLITNNYRFVNFGSASNPFDLIQHYLCWVRRINVSI